MTEERRPVLHLVDSGGLYGAERVILTLVEQQRGASYAGVVGSIREHPAVVPAVARRALALDLPAAHFTMGRGYSLRGRRELWRFVREKRVAVVHSHGYKTDILLGLGARRASGVRLVATVHGWPGPAASLRMRLYQALDRRALRSFDAVVAVSESMRGPLQARLRDRTVRTIYNGVPLDPPDRVGALGCPDGEAGGPRPFQVGFLGRLAPVKGVECLLRAMPALLEGGDCRLRIAGDGPLRRSLEELSRMLGVRDRVDFLGYLDEINGFLSEVDVLVMPSLSEGLPMTLLEAALRRVPIVATNVGGIPEVIVDGVHGMLVQPGDVVALARAVAQVRADPGRASARAAAAQERSRERFGAPAMARAYERLYDEVLGGT